MGMEVSRTDTVPTLIWHFQNSRAEMQGEDILAHSGLHVVESVGGVTGQGTCHMGQGRRGRQGTSTGRNGVVVLQAKDDVPLEAEAVLGGSRFQKQGGVAGAEAG